MNNLKIILWSEENPHDAQQHHQRFTLYHLFIPHLH